MKAFFLLPVLFFFFCPFLFSQVIPPASDTTAIQTNTDPGMLPKTDIGGVGIEKDKLLNRGKHFSKSGKNRLIPNTDSLAVTDSLVNRLKIDWTPKLNYNFNVSFDLARGNLNFMTFLPKADLILEAGLLGINASIGYNLAKVNGKMISNDFLFDVMPFISLGEKLSINGIMGTQATSTRSIDNRQKTGMGLSLPFKNKATQKMHIHVNGVYERTEYAPNKEGELLFSNGVVPSGTRLTYGLQFGGNGQVQLGKNGIQLNYNTFLMKAINNKEDFRIGLVTSFIIPIGKKVFFQTNLNYSYENIILQGTEHHDIFLTFGVGLTGG